MTIAYRSNLNTVRGRSLAAVLLTALVIAGCGSQSGATRTVNPFAFRPSASQPTVLADPTMRKLFGLVYGENYPTGNARTLRHDLAHGPAIDVFSSTDLRALKRLQRAGVLEKPIPFATHGKATAYLAIVRASHKQKLAQEFIASVLGSPVYITAAGFQPLPARATTK